MMPNTPFVHRNLPRLLLEAREAVMAHTRPSLRLHGLSDQQWRVLRVLGEHAGDPAGVETGRVAREAYLLGPSLTGVLTRMERDGLISRCRCPVDARRTVVRATPSLRARLAVLSRALACNRASSWRSRSSRAWFMCRCRRTRPISPRRARCCRRPRLDRKSVV